MKTVIELNSVGVCYQAKSTVFRADKKWVLEDISFSIRSGETLGVVGRNGAGKSTMLRLLAEIIEPDRGEIWRQPQIRCSLLTLQLGFNGFLSGRENAIISGMLLGATRCHMENSLDAIRSFSGLGASFDQPLSSYSSGMRARLGFSVALETDPDVLLIDEALGVGDHEFKEKSSEVMKDWIRSDKTVVLVSHDTNAIAKLCDRAVWIENGRVAADGDPGEILAHYYTYDKVVKAIANDTIYTEEEVRNSDFGLDPVKNLEDFKLAVSGELRYEEQSYLQSAGQFVQLYVPYRRPRSSWFITEECGRSVWVEGRYEIAAGGREIESLYNEFEETAIKLARGLRVELEDFRRSDIGLALFKSMSAV